MTAAERPAFVMGETTPPTSPPAPEGRAPGDAEHRRLVREITQHLADCIVDIKTLDGLSETVGDLDPSMAAWREEMARKHTAEPDGHGGFVPPVPH